MLEAAGRFHWVTVDRDRTPEIPKRFSVSAYPSVLVLGKEDENVHRWQAFSTKEVFRERLEEGLERYRLYLGGKAWDVPDLGAPSIADGEGVSSLPAPSDEVPGGIAILGEDLWVVMGSTLHRLDPATGEGRGKQPLEGGTCAGIAAREGALWVLPFDWTSGGAIRVLDPGSGKVVREVVTEGNRKHRHSGAKGIAWHGDRLLVLEGAQGRIHEVDPGTGEVKGTLEVGRTWLAGLASDGRRLLAASRDALLRLDPSTGKVLEERPLRHQVRSLGVRGEEVLLLEQPIFGFGRNHERIQIRPAEGATRIWVLR